MKNVIFETICGEEYRSAICDKCPHPEVCENQYLKKVIIPQLIEALNQCSGVLRALI